MVPDKFCEQVKRHTLKMHPDIRDVSLSKLITNIETLHNNTARIIV
jgi:hypothetical protein